MKMIEEILNSIDKEWAGMNKWAEGSDVRGCIVAGIFAVVFIASCLFLISIIFFACAFPGMLMGAY